MHCDQQPYDFNGSDQSARCIDLPSIVAQAVFAECILILTRSIGDRARIANFAYEAVGLPLGIFRSLSHEGSNIPHGTLFFERSQISRSAPLVGGVGSAEPLLAGGLPRVRYDPNLF